MNDNLHDAVMDAQRELESNGYGTRKVVVYAHPTDKRGFVKDHMSWIETVEKRDKIGGLALETTPNVPRGTVMVAHLEAARYGPGAIAFGQFEVQE